MITLTKDAKSKINKYCAQKEMRACYFSALEAYTKNYEVEFSGRMQNLITKIGLIMSEISTTHKIPRNTFLGSVDYLCNKVIDDKSRQKFLLATSINENGNKNKHTLAKHEEINIKECVHQYHEILNAIANKYNLPEILKLKLNQKSTTPKKQPPKNIFAEARSIKYDSFDGNDIKFTLSPFYEFDKFKKVAIVELAVDWEKKSNDSLKLTISGTKWNSNTLLVETINLSKSKYENLRIPVSENEMRENNLLELYIKVDVIRPVTVTKTRKQSYTTGILFWKETHYYDQKYETTENQKVFSKTISIAQCLREERNK